MIAFLATLVSAVAIPEAGRRAIGNLPREAL
jgi:hypothetical protein